MNNEAIEKKILEGCQNGKSEYQEKFYQLFYGKMMAIAMRYAKDADEAKDILQEGFIKVFGSIKQFKGEGSLEGWVKRIMVNTAINFYNKNKKNNTTSFEDNLVENNALENQMTDEDLEDDSLNNLTYDEILVFIRKLPPAYQTVFNLYVIEQYSHKEIANLLHINEGTSKSNLAK
ncbi:MAG: RNA polymerase sigma factor, partial [Bacteroidetes bacterium]